MDIPLTPTLSIGVPPAWTRQPAESGPAFAAFRHYLDAGPLRTLDLAWRQRQQQSGSEAASSRGRAPRYWWDWNKRWNWEQRARAFDAHVADIQQKARNQVLLEAAREDQQRREKQRARETKLLDLGWEKLEAMLGFGLARRKSVSADGKVTTIFEPVRWNMGTAVSLAEMLIKLGRVNAKMPTVVEAEIPPEEYEADERYI